VGARTAARKLTPHPLYRLYRKRKIARERSRYRPRVVEHTYGGFRLSVRLADPQTSGVKDQRVTTVCILSRQSLASIPGFLINVFSKRKAPRI